MSELVSIISPCYNGEKYLSAFLVSVLHQTYQEIELVFVDDGSTDETRKIAESFLPQFETAGIKFIYLYQENAGQAAAVNRGLKAFSGKYVMWCDSDDILLPDNIQKKVDYLRAHEDCGFVLCKGVAVNETAIEQPLWTLQRNRSTDTLFEDLIYEKDVIYVPASILVRTELLKTAIPNLEIYESRQGQNWQLMLPIAYCYKSGYIDEALFKYVLHDDSHSHSKRTYQQKNERADEFEKLIGITIKNIPGISNKETEHWNKELTIKYNRVKLRNAFDDFVVRDMIYYRRELRKLIKLKPTDYYLGYQLRKSFD